MSNLEFLHPKAVLLDPKLTALDPKEPESLELDPKATGVDPPNDPELLDPPYAKPEPFGKELSHFVVEQ